MITNYKTGLTQNVEHSQKRRVFGKAVSRDLSPFVEDIEKRLRTHEAPVLKKKKKNKHVQLELF